MKKLSFLILIALFFTAFGCKKSDEIYSFYRVSHPQNFVTNQGAELYAYAADDSMLIRADYFLKVLGQVSTYGNTIIDYGHCWHPTNPNPTIGVDTLRTNSKTGDNIDDVTAVFPKEDSISFTSVITRLNADTKYYIRSYVITGDAEGNPIDTGYNPVVTEVFTKDAIDEWFPIDGEIGVERPGGFRFDALGFNFGDTVIFGTGNQGSGNLTNSMWMYDPVTRLWNGDFRSLPTIEYYPGSTGAALVDGIGFGVEFADVNAPVGQKNRCIYVGLGDYVGDDLFEHKSNTILQYDFTKGNNIWTPVEPFIGSRRSGAVCFAIGTRAYIGTGKGQFPLSDWYVFYPEYARDGNGSTPAWRSMGTNVPGGPSAIARTGAIAFTVNGRGYFGLGRDASDNFLNDFWEFRPNNVDPTKGTWTKKADFPGAPRQNAVAFAVGNQGYVGTGDNIIGDMEGSYTGDTFDDFYRYDPFNNKWYKMRDYTSNKNERLNISKKVTRAVGFSSTADNVGYIGFGIVPDSSFWAQEDLWMYRPFESGAK